jgi:hypothetical protein
LVRLNIVTKPASNEADDFSQGVEMEKGIKSTEFYIVSAVLVPWISQQFGVDLSAVLSNPDDIASVIRGAQGMGGNAPVWVAAAYVIGRVVLKWRGLK